MKKRISASLPLLILVLAACNFPRQSPAATPALTLPSTLAPTNTFVPLAQAPDAVSSLVPESQHASEWNGIPIMPGAIAGEGDEESYVFTVRATPQQVQEYYQRELDRLGWQPFAMEDQASSLMLMFTNNALATLTITIIAKDDQVLVLLAN